MRLLIVTAGSRGDVGPYTGVGARLRAAGHDVTLAADPEFEPMVTGAGLRFRPVPGDLRALQATSAGLRLHRAGGTPHGLTHFVRLGHRMIDGLGDHIAAAAESDTEALLLATSTAPLGYSVAEHHGIPSMGLFLQPVHPTAAFPSVLAPWPLGRVGNRLVGRLARVVARAVYAGASRRLRARLRLPPIPLGALERRAEAARYPILHGFSPAVLPRPPDWRPGLEVAGYWWPAPVPGWRPPAALVDFLADGPPPVFVGFGSMAGDGERLSELVVPALRRAGVRGVVQSGWAGLSAGRAGPDIITIGDVPHDWLFPRVTAVVHHAGSGTSAAGLRAGVPAVPVPMLADQPFWAGRLVALGVAPRAIPARRLTVESLAAAIRAAVTQPVFARRARALADRLATEDGAGAVVRAVERLAG
ncbi:UDP:flavonoid glycosyltransferase YjiC, YdhE family [Micromonospora pattaloongensis]|uniref:UDP:flavonoid glycosyltransferase YjiC, YdhE family n=1 Tax=Micromonospora pattaloongensis TaxID=405436 RepID=A0A1H3Q8D9_9ACTN|nr:glycosyltransferase [Micromonospora pattaloongensis]SDZ09647.1 UDP:flavonoid glycosyltransferase YjiC, YdhE family [Micromonospora pattaloongensis]